MSAKFPPLTEKQYAIMMSFVDGQRTKQVAYELKVSEATIAKHCTAIRNKFDASTMVEAVWKYAQQQNGSGGNTPSAR